MEHTSDKFNSRKDRKKKKTIFNPSSKDIDNAVNQFLKSGGKITKVETETTFAEKLNPYGKSGMSSTLEFI